MIASELPGYRLPFLIDLQMLVTNGGRERTAGQYPALLADGGYELERIIDLPAVRTSSWRTRDRGAYRSFLSGYARRVWATLTAPRSASGGPPA